MSGPSNVPETDVLVLRHGELDAGIAHRFGAQRLAEITHLPGGIASNQLKSVSIPPGGNFAECPEGSDSTLIYVVSGQITASWGSGPQHTATADRGDTLLVPGGAAIEAVNPSPVESLQLILVRGA